MTRRALTLLACLVLASLCATACGGLGADEQARAASAAGPGGKTPTAPPAAASPGGVAAAGTAPQPTACDTATGNKVFVGPGKTHARPSQAAATAPDGAVVVISAGDYVGDVASWPQNNLTLCGAGGRARLFAAGKHAAGKGIWVIRGRNVTVDSVEFHDAKVPDRNGAGIRAEGNGLTLINTGFYNNENGILGPSAGELTISRSEFARNGVGDRGRTHNIYVARADKVTVTSSFFHQAFIGHNFKSRAKETRIENSYFMDGPSGRASYQIDVPNGGVVVLRGNLLQKGPLADNNVSVSYGAEGLAAGIPHTLTMVHNTLASTHQRGTFLSVAAGVASVQVTANIFAGTGAATYRGGGMAKIVERDNIRCQVTGLSAPDDITRPDFWPTGSSGDCLGKLGGTPDPAYRFDAPAPFEQRPISTPLRQAGALQQAIPGPAATPPRR